MFLFYVCKFDAVLAENAAVHHQNFLVEHVSERQIAKQLAEALVNAFVIFLPDFAFKPYVK